MGHYTSNISACYRWFSDRLLMTPYLVIIPLQRRHPLISLMAYIMIRMSNPITEPSRVIPSRVLRSQNREFTLLTNTVLCSRPRSLPPLALHMLLLTPYFLKTPSNRVPCSVTPVSSTHIPVRAVSWSGARSIL